MLLVFLKELLLALALELAGFRTVYTTTDAAYKLVLLERLGSLTDWINDWIRGC
jgi:hypothetical protein